jgi:hypothetical protein
MISEAVRTTFERFCNCSDKAWALFLGDI